MADTPNGTSQGFCPDQRTAQRIVSGIRRIEGPQQTFTNPAAFREATTRRQAAITASDSNTNSYSWIALSPNSDGTWSQNESWGSGDYTETEDPNNIVAKSMDGCIDVLYGDHVELFMAPGQNYYSFRYRPPGRQAQVQTTFSGSGYVYVGSQKIHAYECLGASIPQNASNLPVTVWIEYGKSSGGVGQWQITKWPCG